MHNLKVLNMPDRSSSQRLRHRRGWLTAGLLAALMVAFVPAFSPAEWGLQPHLPWFIAAALVLALVAVALLIWYGNLCPKCGGRLPRRSAPPAHPELGQPALGTTPLCPHCGVNLEPGDPVRSPPRGEPL